MAKTVSKSKRNEKIELIPEVVDWKAAAETFRKQSNDIRKRYEILEIYTKRIESKAKELAEHKKRIASEEIKKNEQTRKEILKDKEIRVRDIIIKQMQFELKKQREVSKIHDSQYHKEQEFHAIKTTNKIPVIIIDDFDKDTIMFAHRDYGLKDQVVWFRALKDSTQALNLIRDLSPKIILNSLNDESNEHLKNQGIMIIDVKPEIHEFYGSVSSDQLGNTMSAKERKEFLNWLGSHRRGEI